MMNIFKNKTVAVGILVLATSPFTWAQKKAPDDWFNLDMKKDKVPGVSTNKAYAELLKDKKSKTVIVAVIDGGTDVKQEDLKDIIWTNDKEIAGNGIDDDHNGYIDDIHGWSFISGKDSDVVEDTYELTRMYAMLKPKYEKADTNQMDAAGKKEYKDYLKIKKEFQSKSMESKNMVERLGMIQDLLENIQKQTGKENPTAEEIKAYKTESPFEKVILGNLEPALKKGMTLNDLKNDLKGAMEHYQKSAAYSFNPDFNPRIMIGDNYSDPYEHHYGSNRVSGPTGEHGTHVAGIIAAVRNNNKGMNGVSDNVRIMVIRAVPDGDERDKDVANAIKYAADNGATIINMSFGKAYSPYKKAVDDAVKYAVSKDVLLVHAAGNDNKNTDIENNFPRDEYKDGGIATSWIEVGASSWEKGKNITAPFSNYAVQNVDLFAPGVDIYSTLPDNKYASFDGTSMAAPVTAGVAALVRSYYPTLTALQVKEILMQSVVPVKGKVLKPGTKEKVKMKELCISGGIVNAYNAIKLAEAQTKK